MRENICTQCHVNNLARTESFWVFSPDFSSLINNISNIKQSNFDLHFLKTENCLFLKQDFDRPRPSKYIVSSSCRMFMLANALVQVSGCVPDIICVAQITLKFMDHALIVYNCRLFLFRGEDLADLLRLKDRLNLYSNFCAQIYGVQSPPKINFGTQHRTLRFNVELKNSTSNLSTQRPTL